MPAENAAKQNNLDPKTWIEENISNMKIQLKKRPLIDWIVKYNMFKSIININKTFLNYIKKLVYKKKLC